MKLTWNFTHSHIIRKMLQIHTLFSLFPVEVPFWRYRCASRATFFSSLSSELYIEVVHPFCIDKARKRSCIEHRVVNFITILEMHWHCITILGDILFPRLTYFTNGEFIVLPHILIGGSSQRSLSVYCAQCNVYFCFLHKSRGGRLQCMWPNHGIPCIQPHAQRCQLVRFCRILYVF